jgi:geranylgeranyl diphosphate synthase type I
MASVDALDTRGALALIRGRIDEALVAFLAEATRYIQGIGPELDPVADAMRSFMTDGGKRFRPLLGAIGSMAVDGSTPDDSTIRACTSLELLHACALIHDDVMDGSDTRRGNPSIHRLFEAMHRKRGLTGESDRYGVASAILLGDLALIWADLALHSAGLDTDRLIAALPIYDELRVELMAGQYLDVHEQSLASTDAARSLKVASFKSGKYSIERPLHFGARISLADEATLAALSAYGIPVGEAFQLRDDLLGVFGDPSETGKPAGDDLREGKRTVLIAFAMEGANNSTLALLERLGDQSLDHQSIDKIREAIISTGAVSRVEGMISARADEAHRALESDRIAQEAKPYLELMAQMALVRNH